jgi:enediyne biosynthesis protein E4
MSLRSWYASLLVPAALALVAAAGCDRSPAKSVAGPARNNSAAGPDTEKPKSGDSGALLVDVTERLGLPGRRSTWPAGRYMTPEITPGGIALFDYDGDGDLDIYQVCHCEPGSFTKPAPNRLFQQQADGTFKEVPGAAGLDDPGFGHGVAVGDIDNDGDLDVYVTNYGSDAFYRNNGDGTFTNATKAAGFGSDTWSSSLGFLDYDRDGFLDLFVVRFATFDPERRCKASHEDADDFDYCGPHTFDGVMDTLYHNNGDGTFTDVTEKAGIDQPGRGWGLACADVTGDGWPDIYVANDEEPAQLWVNQQDGTFIDEAVLRGCAFNINGRVEAGMGVGIGDIDGDGALDLFKTHIASETNTLYQSSGQTGNFTDRTSSARMGAVDRPFTGWGCGFFDIDHDGDLDVAIANGRVAKGTVWPQAELGKFWNRFAEPKLLFENDGHGNFADISSHAGGFGRTPNVARGLAFGDLDGDGDIDLVAENLDNSLTVYRNDGPKPANHWLIVRAMTGKRDAYGAIITASVGKQRLVRLAHPTYSYLSSSDPRAHFGLGTANRIDELTVAWPSGRIEQFVVESVDRVVTVVEGEGRVAETDR